MRDNYGPNKGILYVAFGEKYRNEAIQSANRLFEIGDWNISIITDEPGDEIQNIFDNIIIGDSSSSYDSYRFGGDIKPVYFAKTPYEKTLYLDTDTYVVDSNAVSEIFELLDQYDLTAAFDTHRKIEWQYRNQDLPDISSPDSFPWLNTGVVGYRSNERTTRLFNSWNDKYHEHSKVIDGIADQAPFVEALYESDVNHTVLPTEYNHRTPFQQTLRGKTKIIHGHHNNSDEVSKYINEELPNNLSQISSANELFQSFYHYTIETDSGTRVVPVKLKRPLGKRLEYNILRVQQSVSDYGLKHTGRKIAKYIKNSIL